MLRVLRALMPYVPRSLHALMPHIPHVSLALRALLLWVPYALCDLDTLVPMHYIRQEYQIMSKITSLIFWI